MNWFMLASMLTRERPRKVRRYSLRDAYALAGWYGGSRGD